MIYRKCFDTPQFTLILSILVVTLLQCILAKSGQAIGKQDLPYDVAEAIRKASVDENRSSSIEGKLRTITENAELSGDSIEALREILVSAKPSNITLSSNGQYPAIISEPQGLCLLENHLTSPMLVLSDLWHPLKSLLKFGTKDELVLKTQLDYGQLTKGDNSPELIVFQRLADGIVVEDDGIRIWLSSIDVGTGCRKISSVAIRWSQITYTSDWDGVMDAETIISPVEEAHDTITSLDLRYLAIQPNTASILVYRMVVDQGPDRFVRYFNAYSGELIHEINTTRNSAWGYVKIPVNLPYEEIHPLSFYKACSIDQTTNCHPLPYTYISSASGSENYDDYWVGTPPENVIQSVEVLEPVAHPILETSNYSTNLARTNYDGFFYSSSGFTGNELYIDNNKAYYYNNLSLGEQSVNNVFAVDRTNKPRGRVSGIPVDETAEMDNLCQQTKKVTIGGVEQVVPDGPLTVCSSKYFVQSAPFSGNGSTSYFESPGAQSWTYPNYLGLRNEMQFFLNYGQHFMREQMNLPVRTTVNYHYSWQAINSASGFEDGPECEGQSGNQSIRLHCRNRNLDNRYQHTRPYQMAFRRVLFHEYGHFVENSINAINSGAPWAGYYGFESLYSEAFSQITEAILSRFETVTWGWFGFGPDRKWPTAGMDDCSSVYNRSSSFLSIFFDMLMYLGYDAAKVIYRTRDGVYNDTVMVGDCRGGTSFQYDWRYCPANSYFSNAIGIAKAQELNGGYPVYEVSKAFLNHIEDSVPYSTEPACVGCPSAYCLPDPADPSVCPTDCCDDAITSDIFGTKELTPPFDDVTNIRTLAAPISLFLPTSVSSMYSGYPTIAYTPDPFPSSGRYKRTSLYSDVDRDIFSFIGVQGIEYTFYGIPSGARVCLTIKDSLGATLATSSSCYSTSLSYGSLTFVPAMNDIYSISISANSGYQVSDENYYSLMSYLTSGDEYADSSSGALPAIVDVFIAYTEDIRGYLHDSSDIDYVYFDLYDQSYVTFSMESNSIALATLEDDNGNALALAWNDGTEISGVYPAGRYYIKSVGVGNQFYSLNIGAFGALASTTDATNPTQLVSNNIISHPGPVDNIGTYRGQFFSSGEEHYYKINVNEGSLIQLFTHNLQAASGGNASVDTVIELLVPDRGFFTGDYITKFAGEVMMRDDDGGCFDDLASRIQFVAPVTGDYIVKVRQPVAETEPQKGNSTGIGRYQLSVMISDDDYSSSSPRFPGE